VGLKGWIRRIEERRRGRPEPPCEKCHGFIITEEIMEDGSVRYPHGPHCAECGSRGSARIIGRIVVDMRGREGESDRGDLYQLVSFDE
jgi:hypothetical protein